MVEGSKRREEEKLATGSRLKPADPLIDYRGFVSQIASSTGVAGLTPQSGMDPFAGPTRSRTIRTCRSSDKRLSWNAICELAKAREAITKNDYDGAQARLNKVLASSTSNQADRFFAYRFKYEIALARQQPRQASKALFGMIETDLLLPRDRVLALKTLAQSALGEDDKNAAIAWLERAVKEAPNDVKAQANLGVLYSQTGDHDRARPRIAEAIRLSRQAGLAVPDEWTAYLRN